MSGRNKKIFIATSSEELLGRLLAAPEAAQYQIKTAFSGPEALKKIKDFTPDLILMDLMLPEVHGIEILKMIRGTPKLKNCGVIIMTDYILIQNYHAAIKEGADYFLNKPFTEKHFFTLAKRFFLKKLKPEPFHGLPSESSSEKGYYVPSKHRPNHYVRFWGTRGSNAVSGSKFLRFGGNTCCLEIRAGKDHLIIDSGTGICTLGQEHHDFPSKTINLFFSHTHWDHVTGFPFFDPIYDKSYHINMWAPFGFEKNPRELFTEMLAYTFFPVRLDDIKARLTFNDLQEGKKIKIGSMEICTHYAFHPGATLCFKIKAGGKTFGYVTDNEFLMGNHGHPNSIKSSSPLLQPHLSLIDFFKGCDFLIHEAQYFPEEYVHKVGWGHSSVANAVVLIKQAGIKEWIVTHHDPSHTDKDLQEKFQMTEDILKECKVDCNLQFAYDGLVYPL